jgi:hypothetical protein
MTTKHLFLFGKACKKWKKAIGSGLTTQYEGRVLFAT